MPHSCALLGGFAIAARTPLLWQHNANANVSEYMLVLAIELYSNFFVRELSIFHDDWNSGVCG